MKVFTINNLGNFVKGQICNAGCDEKLNKLIGKWKKGIFLLSLNMRMYKACFLLKYSMNQSLVSTFYNFFCCF